MLTSFSLLRSGPKNAMTLYRPGGSVKFAHGPSQLIAATGAPFIDETWTFWPGPNCPDKRTST
jgi:hypothetical protein